MTNEKAIEILKLYKQRLEESVSTELGNDIQAFEMAISALENNYNSAESDGDLISRESVITMLNKIENAVEDGDGFQFNEWVEYAKDIPSAEKTTLSAEKTTITDGDLISKIDKLPRIKVGNSNSPTVKYCIDEVLLYDLLEHYKESKEEE